MKQRLATLIAVLLSGVALGDPPAPANGIKIGEGRLHPYFLLEGRYDSAAGYYGTPPKLSGEIVGDFRPGLRFGLETPNTLINFDGFGEYVWYTGLITSTSNQLSRIQAGVSLDTAFNKIGAVEVQFGDSLSRSDRSTNPIAGIGILSLFNSAHLSAPIHPGGGALAVAPTVRWDVEFFSPLLPSPTATPPGCPPGNQTCNPPLVSLMNYSNLNFGLGGKWKFLPKTAFILDATFDYRTYFTASDANRVTELLKIQGGIAGLITSHLSMTLLVGGGGDWGGSAARTVIGQAELAYLGDIGGRLGYLRSLNPVPRFGSYAQDRAYAEFKAGLLQNRLSFRLFGSFDYLSYFSGVDTMAREARNDYIISAEANIGYQIFNWWSISAGYTLTKRYSTVPQAALNYPRHEPRLTLTFQY